MNARATSPFDACLQLAQVLAADWVPAWLTHIQTALKQKEVSARQPHEKQAYAQACFTLFSCRDRLAAQVLAGLNESIRVGAVLASPGAGVRKAQALSLDELELMDHRQVQASVELARLHQVVKLAVDDELIALGALLSAAQGLKTVRPEANPVRPEVIVDALMAAIDAVHVDDASRARWLHAGAVSLGTELQRFYAALTRRLEADGVRPAGFVVVPTLSAVRPSWSGPAPRADSELVASAEAAAPVVLTLDHLHRLLVGNLSQAGAEGDVGESAMGRTLAAEVVSLMLRTIADDQRLLRPVRDMVLQLKPALLSLAKADPRFFADKDNPARRLLDLITARSLAYAHEQDPGFAEFARRVLETVQSLQTPAADLPERMADCVQEMDRLDRSDQRVARQTLVRVEQRHLLAGQVSGEIQGRSDFARAPALIKRFLLGPWAQVVAEARLETGQEADISGTADGAAQRYMAIVPDLLWSCQLSQASLNRARLVRVVPVVLRTLREGLDAIDYPRAKSESFFQALLGLHEAAWKTQRSEEFLNSSLPSSDEPAHEPWLHGSEVRDSGFLDAQTLASDFADTQPMEREQRPSSGETLQVGAWIELQQGEQAQRCQLRWASPHRTMFLFATADGHSVSLTRRGFDRLESAGRLRVVAEHGVVDEALTAVAQLAWVNSGKLS